MNENDWEAFWSHGLSSVKKEREQMTVESTKFESWGVLDLFGHTRLAGYITEATIGGCSFVRVDVPAVGGQPEFTRYFGQGAIYSISPTTEELARKVAESSQHQPVQAYELPRPKLVPALAPPDDEGIDPQDDDDDDDPPY